MIILTETKRLRGENKRKRCKKNKSNFYDFEYVIERFIKDEIRLISRYSNFAIEKSDYFTDDYVFTKLITNCSKHTFEGNILKINPHNIEELLYNFIRIPGKEYTFITDLFLLRFYNYLSEKNLINKDTIINNNKLTTILRKYGFREIGLIKNKDGTMSIKFYYNYFELKTAWKK